MIKRFCNVCGKVLPAEYTILIFCDKYWDMKTDGSKEICHDCEQAIRACIGNRKAKAERGKDNGNDIL